MVDVIWAFRSRVSNEDGGSWGVHGGLDVNFEPIDWSVTRSYNQPAVAQVVLSADGLNQEQWDALRNIVNLEGHSPRYWGLSCFRSDFPEEADGDAVFFGPITMADVSHTGLITLHAEDMLSVAKGNLVGKHSFDNRDALTVCQAICDGWVQEQPKANGLQFKGEGGTLSYQVEPDEGKTLYDVIQDVCDMNGLMVWHDRSIDIRFGWPNQGEPLQLGRSLEGASFTRLFGPEAQPNIIRMVGGDNGKDGRAVFTSGGGSLGEWEYAVGAVETAPDGVDYATMASIGNTRVQYYKSPALTFSGVFPWSEGVQFPRPGQRVRGHMDNAVVAPNGDRRGFSVLGMAESVEISPDTFSVSIVTRGQ